MLTENPRITCSKDFENYASTCFRAFGDRVKYWITFNEPHGFSIQGYDTGLQAPGRCSIFGRVFCKRGKSSVEPYIVAHNILLSHAAAYQNYKLNFRVLLTPSFYRSQICPGNETLLKVSIFIKCLWAGKARRSDRNIIRRQMVRTDIRQ